MSREGAWLADGSEPGAPGITGPPCAWGGMLAWGFCWGIGWGGPWVVGAEDLSF